MPGGRPAPPGQAGKATPREPHPRHARSLTRTPDPALYALQQDGHELVFSRPGETPSEAALLALVPGCVGWLAGVEPISPRVLEAAAGLRAISRNGAGADNIPLDVAELAFGLALASLRHVPEHCAALKAAAWQRRTGLEIEGRTLGLIGCGAIGRLVARFALAFDVKVRAFDAKVRAFDPCPDPGFRPDGDFAWAELDAVLEQAEILSLHCPMPPGGRPLLDAAALARLRPGCHVVNTARAGLVDEAAMPAALEAERVRVYATDVFAVGPPEPSDLLRHPRVIATPRIGGLTAESVRRATVAAVENLRTELASSLV